MRSVWVVCCLALVVLAFGCWGQQSKASEAAFEAPAAELEPLEPVESFPEASVEPEPVFEPAPVAAAETYIVRRGDTLYGIARRLYGDGKLWTLIRDANRDRIADINAIPVGTELRIPPKP